MANRKQRKPREEDFIEQDSLFLQLPREIRDHIYRFAVNKPTPIELCPTGILTTDETQAIPVLNTRLQKSYEKNLTSRRRMMSYQVRRPNDLEHVRKELAIGILATCMQVYNEAWHLLYRENTFRFSADDEFVTLRRFLTTIGPRNITQLKTLDVCSYPATYEASTMTLSWNYKNHPKLQMAKLSKDADVWENAQYVKRTLKAENTPLLRNVRLPVPAEWDGSITPRYISCLERLAAIFDPWVKLTLVLQSGSFMQDRNWVPDMANLPFNIILKKGCQVIDPEEIVEKDEIYLTTHTPALDYVGISELFTITEETTAARGGKANRFSGSHKLSRNLRGFGGCRFEHLKGHVCIMCFQKVYPKRLPKGVSGSDKPPGWDDLANQHCPSFGPAVPTTIYTTCRWQYVECVVMKHAERASRMGVVRTANPITGWL